MSAKQETEAIAAELKVALLYSDRNSDAVKKISEISGLTRRTVYDYLDGNIKVTLQFLHACVIATNGDPDIKKFLEPDGWRLTPINTEDPPGDKSLPEECLDDLPAMAAFHKAINDPGTRDREIEDLARAVRDEVEQDLIVWRRNRRNKGVGGLIERNK